jgi:hypothetical protein
MRALTKFLSIFVAVASAACASLFGIDTISYSPPLASSDEASLSDATAADREAYDAIAVSRPAVPGIVLWLDSRSGVNAGSAAPGSVVTRWLDTTPSHNDAIGGTVGDAASGPTYVSSAFGALPAIDLRPQTDAGLASELNIPDDPSLRFGAGEFCVLMLYSFRYVNAAPSWSRFISRGLDYTSSTVGWGLFSYNAGVSFQYRGYPPTSSTLYFREASSNFAYDDGQPHLIVGRVAKSDAGSLLTMELSVDRHVLSVSQVQPINTDAVADGLRVGNRIDPGYSLNGLVAEIVLVKGPLSDADLGTLENYLMSLLGK